MMTPYIVPPRQTASERPLGPQPLHRISPAQALTDFFSPATQNWLETVQEEQSHQAELDPDRPLQARDIMQPGVVTVGLDTRLRELVQLLTKRKISGVPVVDEEGRPAGVVSLTDVASYVGQSWVRSRVPGTLSVDWEQQLQDGLGDVAVSEIMSPFVYYAEAEANLIELSHLMLEHHIHRVLIVEDEAIVGIVSSLDIIAAFARVRRR